MTTPERAPPSAPPPVWWPAAPARGERSARRRPRRRPRRSRCSRPPRSRWTPSRRPSRSAWKPRNTWSSTEVKVWAAALALGAFLPAAAQQLEPRAYSASPVDTTFAGVGYVHSSGDVVFDASLPFTDVSARIHVVAPFYLRTFGLLGRQASAGIVLPYAWGTVQGNVGETFRRADRSGFADVAVRLAVGFLGAPALS